MSDDALRDLVTKIRSTSSHQAQFALAAYVRDAVKTAGDRADRYAGEIAEIKGSLSQVAVYEGLEGSPTALLVSELVKDHEELEARIDAALSVIAAGPETEMYQEVARLLRGGKRVPDDLSELDDDHG